MQHKIILTLLLSVFSTVSFALPFNITPKDTLPTTVPLDSTVSATYIVKNNTQTQRNNNYVKYLPRNVTVAAGGCGTMFSLASGATCELNLTISGAVNAKDPDPHHHLFVCFAGGISCAGPDIANALNVAVVNAPPANPPILYGVTGNAGTSKETLFTLDTTNGNATSLMTFTVTGDGESIASDGINLYRWNGYTSQTFESINLQNLTTTPIPTSGAPTSEIFGAVYYHSVNAFLAADGNSEFFTYSTSGVVADIGNIGSQARGMACWQHKIYAIDPHNAPATPAYLYELNPSNGSIIPTSTKSITLAGYTVRSGQGLTVHPLTGVFYAILSVEPLVSGAVRKLVTLDINTGTATLIGDADNGTGLVFSTIAFHPADPTC